MRTAPPLTRAPRPRSRRHRRSSIVSVGRTLLLFVGLAVIPACARQARPAGPAAEEREVVYRAESKITVRIINRSQVDAIVYVVHDGTRDRLGAVTAASTATFSVRGRSLGASGEFALLADPVGALRATSTEMLHVSQGSSFTWTLESDFTRGSILIQD